MSIAWNELYAIVMAVHIWGIYSNVKKYYYFNCDNQTVVDIWEKVAPNLPKSWHWYGCYIFVLHITTFMFVFNTFLVTATTLLIPSLASRRLTSRNSLWRPRQHLKTSLHGHQKPSQSPCATLLSWCH